MAQQDMAALLQSEVLIITDADGQAWNIALSTVTPKSEVHQFTLKLTAPDGSAWPPERLRLTASADPSVAIYLFEFNDLPLP